MVFGAGRYCYDAESSGASAADLPAQAGTAAVRVDRELLDLIERANRVSELTKGAFDISYASMDQLWKYDGSMTQPPSSEAMNASVAHVGYQNIRLDKEKSAVFLTEKGMKIGFGGIGKGYAADRAKAKLVALGVSAGIINAAGDLTAWGTQPNGQDWTIAITNPLNKAKAFSWLPVRNSAVVTSGNYEKFVVLDGVRYSHIIDPRTGIPSQGIVSATILTKSAELADALATAVFVMGLEVGLDFINQLNGVDCILVDEDNQLHTSINVALKESHP